MPYKDEKLFWKVRLPRKLRSPIEKQAYKLGFPNVACLTAAVDSWLKMSEEAQKSTLDRVEHP